MTRDELPLLVAQLIDRPVRWVPRDRLVGDYDGRERTLEVFNADAKDQRQLLGTINKAKLRLEEIAGGPLTVIFHSTKQSVRYEDFVRSFRSQPRPHPIVTKAVPPLAANCVDEANETGPHRRVA